MVILNDIGTLKKVRFYNHIKLIYIENQRTGKIKNYNCYKWCDNNLYDFFEVEELTNLVFSFI